MSRFFAANQAGTVATLGFVLALFIFVGCSKTETSSISAESPADKSSQGAANTKYELGNIIKFGAGGDSERFRTCGWTEGNSAVLIFSGLPRSQPLTLKMTIVGLTKPAQPPAQPTAVYANGKKIDWQVADKKQYVASISAHAVNNTGILTLKFHMPKAASPQSLGINPDPRELALGIFDLVYRKSFPVLYEAGQSGNFIQLGEFFGQAFSVH